MADTDNCALCGGDLEEHAVSEEREERIRKNTPDLDGKTIHAKVCTECGHISYYSE